MSEKKELKQEKLEKVSGGYAGENRKYICPSPTCGRYFLGKEAFVGDDGMHCPSCGELGEPYGD